jgi:predicted RNase H-like HicB family nuclease
MRFGYTSNIACKIANISYRQLHYWDKVDLVKPSVAAAHGTGSRRIYSFADLVCLRVAAELKQEGTSLQKIRKSVAYLSSSFPDQDQLPDDLVFLTDGNSMFVTTQNPDVILDALQSSQFILCLALGRIAADTRDKILRLEREEESQGHVFEVVIEPDKDVYLAYCPELPGCITWGHTQAEAFQYIEDAVELYLGDLIEDGEPIPGIGVVGSIEDIKPLIRIKSHKAGKEKAIV